MIDPAGRVVMISGASRGIGRAIAERLYALGYSLSLGARDPEDLASLVGRVDARRVMTHEYEALDADAPGIWVEATVARFGRLDALVNNAGLLHPVSIETGTEAELDHMWDVNARAPWRMIRAAWPHLKAAGSGRIVNIASITGLRVKSPEATGYAMSKFATVALTHGVRQEGWPHGIRAAALCPGFVSTDMTDGWTTFPREAMVDAETVAETASLLIALPNNASVATLALNCQPEAAW